MQQFLQSLPGGYWLDGCLEDVRHRAAGMHPSDSDLGVLIDEITRNLGHNRTGRAANLLLLGLLLDQERFLKMIRVKGALRPSKYDLRGERIRCCTVALMEHAGQMGLSESSKEYLPSVHALSIVADGARELRNHLRTSVRDGRTVKSLLVALDMLFLLQHEPRRGDVPPTAWQYYSKEELAEGFSLAFYLYHSSGHRVTEIELGSPVDPKVLTSDVYETLLAHGAILRAYHEWEFEVDTGSHHAHIEGTTIVLRPTDERTEKATRLGYIQSEQMRLKAGLEHPPKDAVSLAAVAERLHAILKQNDLLRLVDEPVRRLVLELPNVPQLVAVLKDDAFFAEEVAYLHYSGLSYLIAPEGLTTFVVRGTVTVRDLVKAARLVNLLRQVLRLEILALLAAEPETAAQSVLPVYHRDQLLTLLSIAVDREKAEELLHFWEWTGDGIFDLQYQPLLRAGHYYTIPMNVFADSDVIRNALQLARVRIHHQEDPSERALANAFVARGVPARHGVRYHHNGQDGEIDVLVVLDGIAFAFECKNSLLPTSPFEFRQMLAYLQRANEQLDRLKIFWQDPTFVRALRQSTGLDLVPGMPLVTCAVTANRMLSGSLFGSHPVRGLFELGSFLHLGGITLLGQSVRVVSGSEVSGADLRAYIEGDSLHARFLAAMVPYEATYMIGQVEVRRRSFVLSLPRIAEEFGLDIPEDVRRAWSEEQPLPDSAADSEQ